MSSHHCEAMIRLLALPCSPLKAKPEYCRWRYFELVAPAERDEDAFSRPSTSSSDPMSSLKTSLAKAVYS